MKKRRGYGNASGSRYAGRRGPAGNQTLPEERPSSSPSGWWMRKVNVCSKKQTTGQAHSRQRADHAGLKVNVSTRTAASSQTNEGVWQFPPQGSGRTDMRFYKCTCLSPYLCRIVYESTNTVLTRKYF